MAEVTVSYTTPQIEGLTRQKILERFLRDSGFGIYGTATSGSTSTIVDTTRLQSAQYSDTEFENNWARVSVKSGGSGAAPEGEIRTISTFTPGAGKLTATPPFTVAPAVSDIYQIWNYVHPQVILDTIDQICKEDVYLPTWTILSEIPDFDMEQSGTTEWTGANSTLAKSTTEPRSNGKQYLTVAATSGNGYAKCATLSVIPGHTYHLSALVRANAASVTASLIAYDETNSANISNKTTQTRVWGRLWFNFTAPATCYQVTVRLSTVENGSTTSWNGVALWGLSSYDIALPWWVKDGAQVKGFGRGIQQDIGTSLWDANPRFSQDSNRWDFKDEAFGRGQIRAVSKASISDPVYIFGMRNETAYSSETESKKIDANWMASRLGFLMFEQMQAIPNTGMMNMKWVENQYARYVKSWEIERRKQQKRIEDQLLADGGDAWYSRPGMSQSNVWAVQ